MKPDAPRRVLLSGGGVRNGFLWQLVAKQFGGAVERTDAAGVPALARNAAGAAVLAALLCDGVPGNLPLLTGATGGRLLGPHLTRATGGTGRGAPRGWPTRPASTRAPRAA
jgi:anhydro-N-acetylmuramic acid kinase